MDRTFLVLATVTVGCLVVAGAAFGALFYTERTAAETLSSTLAFSITIRPDQTISNVTFLIPLPVDASGTSPVVKAAGAREIAGLPADWNTTLLGADGNTFLGISAGQIPAQGENATPYLLTMHTAAPRTALATAAPEDHSPVIRPRTGNQGMACPPGLDGIPRTCSVYVSHIYAEYEAVPGAQVSIRLELIGTNTWQSLSSHTGSYRDVVSLTLQGPAHGWHDGVGLLAAGIGEEFPGSGR
ncbi:MAG: hypothetical protein LUQ13_02865 [Methanomicrobiales archaeon]|nr:hypothetical protein [Methanomicrobiales archaeon]